MGDWNRIESNDRKPLVFSQLTQNFLLEMILFANRSASNFDRKQEIQTWLSIDWSDRESIRKVLPLIEFSYAAIPEESSLMRRDVDAALFKDNFRMRDGKLRQITSSTEMLNGCEKV